MTENVWRLGDVEEIHSSSIVLPALPLGLVAAILTCWCQCEQSLRDSLTLGRYLRQCWVRGV